MGKLSEVEVRLSEEARLFERFPAFKSASTRTIADAAFADRRYLAGLLTEVLGCLRIMDPNDPKVCANIIRNLLSRLEE